MSKAIPLNQDTKLNKIFNPPKDSKESIEDRIVSGYLKGRAITMIIDSFHTSKSLCSIEKTGNKINKVLIDNKSLVTVKKLSFTPFFIRRFYHQIAMSFNINGYKDGLTEKAKIIADAYYASSNLSVPISNNKSVTKEDSSKKVQEDDSYETKKQILIEKLKASQLYVIIPSEFRNDIDVVLTQIEINQCVPAQIPDSLRTNEIVGLALIRNYPNYYALLEEGMKENEKIAMEAIIKLPILFSICPPKIKNNYNVTLTAVSNQGILLYYASPALRNNRNIVLAAVSQDGSAFIEASEELKKDKQIALTAIKTSPDTYDLLSEKLQQDLDIKKACNRPF